MTDEKHHTLTEIGKASNTKYLQGTGDSQNANKYI